MKVETRGKFPGVKLHLDPDECEILIQHGKQVAFQTENAATVLSAKMGKKIAVLLAENPDLLKERTPEQVAAILVKEVEKQKMQLDALHASGKFDKLNKDELKAALLKHAE